MTVRLRKWVYCENSILNVKTGDVYPFTTILALQTLPPYVILLTTKAIAHLTRFTWTCKPCEVRSTEQREVMGG